MAENTGPSHEGFIEAERPEEARAVQSLIEEMKASPQIRDLGLASEPEEIARSVLCSLWRNTPLQQFDVVRGLLPPGIDLLVATCTRAHGRHRHTPRDVFSRDAFLEDLAEHLGISHAQASTTATSVIRLLRERIPEDERKDVLLYLPEDLKDLLLRPV